MNRKSTALAAAAAAAALGTALGAPATMAAGQLKMGGSTGAALLIQTVDSSFNKKYAAQGISTSQYAGVGSGAGIKGVAAGTYDIGGSSRDPNSSDPKGLTFTPIDKESIVVIANAKNPICKKGLNKAKVQQIFNATATQWSQVGGPSNLGTISVYMRVATSGTQASFIKVYMDGAAPKGSPLQSNSLIRSSVTRNKSGIGFVTGAYVATAAKNSICGVPIGGVKPTLKNVANGKFPYWNYQYLVTKGDPTGDAATYVKYMLSGNVQANIVPQFAVPLAQHGITIHT